MEFTDDPEDEKQDYDQSNSSEAQEQSLDSAEVSVPTAPIPSSHDSNSSGDSRGIGPDNSPKSQASVPSAYRFLGLIQIRWNVFINMPLNMVSIQRNFRSLQRLRRKDGTANAF